MVKWKRDTWPKTGNNTFRLVPSEYKIEDIREQFDQLNPIHEYLWREFVPAA